MAEFRVTDDNLNNYGFRILTAGIDTRQFKKVPTMLWMHRRPVQWGSDEGILPLGTWKNLRKGDAEMFAEPEFDLDDEFAIKIKSKVDKDIIKMASIGVRIIATSDDPKHLLPGQSRPTITKCELLEVSLVDRAGNKNAIKLYDEAGQIVNLADGEDQALPLLSDKSDTTIPKHNKMKKIALLLGLNEEASEDVILSEVQKMKTDADKVPGLNTKITELSDAAKGEDKAKIVSLVDEAVKSGKILGDEKDSYVELGEKMGEGFLTGRLEKLSAPVKPGDTLEGDGPNGGKPEEMGLADMLEKDPDEAERIRTKEPKRFAKLYAAEYGAQPPA